ncbi:hypothetical protein GJ744_007830 [Endocarpon pusillum]|uniref:Uncharacterized protein n=1 Tax=Endocarpon pusillum TaxID=364733 RepID=A0A8H7ASX0_9EURO|nr:hypothetical protein GJ744_007830 [Endocarpon pusillum]
MRSSSGPAIDLNLPTTATSTNQMLNSGLSTLPRKVQFRVRIGINVLDGGESAWPL